MATLHRRRHNLVYGTLGASLTSGGTSITFAAALKEGGSGGTNITTLGTDEYLPLTIEDEVVYLTAYTSGATSGTISRGQEGTTAAAHNNGVAFANTETKRDGGWLDPIVNRLDAANANDDEFLTGTLDGAWTRVDYSNAGAVTWTPGGGLLSAKHDGGDAAQGLHALMRSMSGLSSPVTIQTAVRLFGGVPTGVLMMGLIFANGTTAGSGAQVVLEVHLSPPSSSAGLNVALRSWTGYNAFNADLTGSPVAFNWAAGFIHLRLTWVSANTWRGELSGDGRSWIKFSHDSSTADSSSTMTPTQMGVFLSGYGSGATKAATFTFDHFRVS